MRINLLDETLEVFRDFGITPDQVLYVTDDVFWCTWDEFAIAANRKYDNGYGYQEVWPSLKIVGDGWWFERREYDGSEWWEFYTPPYKPNCKGKVSILPPEE